MSNQNIDANASNDEEEIVMPPIPDIDPETGEILNAEKQDKIEADSRDSEPEVEKTEKEIKAEKKKEAARLRKEKIKAFFAKIFGFFAIFKQKKVWVSLLVIVSIIIGVWGYILYRQVQYNKSTAFIIDTIDKALFEKNLTALLQVFNISVVQDRLKKQIQSSLEKYPDFAQYIGSFTGGQLFNTEFEKIFINIVQGNIVNPQFNKELQFFPEDFVSHIRSTPFVVNEKLSDPDKGIYVLELMLNSVRFGKYPFQIKALYHNDTWRIVEITNLDAMIALFDKEIKKRHIQEDMFKAKQQQNINSIIDSYLPALRCVASMTTLSEQPVLIINVQTDKNNVDSAIVSWGVDAKIFVGEAIVHEEYIKINGIYKAKTAFNYTMNIRVDDALFQVLNGQALVCEASPIMVNLSNGDYFTYGK